MNGNGWFPSTPSFPACVVLVDPHSDRRCGAPASGGHTILDCPVCPQCHDAVTL